MLVGFQPSTFWAALTAAENGTVIYNTSAGASLSVLTWMDRTGKELGRIGDAGSAGEPHHFTGRQPHCGGYQRSEGE